MRQQTQLSSVSEQPTRIQSNKGGLALGDLIDGAEPKTLIRLNFFHSVLRVIHLRCRRSSVDTGPCSWTRFAGDISESPVCQTLTCAMQTLLLTSMSIRVRYSDTL
jgi:hypothetical protein